MIPEIKKETIFDYFSGKASAFQKKQIEVWLADPHNRELFFQWLWEWERNNTQYHADAGAGIARHWERINNGAADYTAVSGPEKPARLSFRRVAAVASVILMIFALGWLWEDDLLFQTYSTSYGEIRKVLLPDSTQVVMNANSTLKVPRFGFGKKVRRVHLSGEADFEVTTQPDQKQFIVKTDHKLDVVVLGTVFNVYARPSGTKVVLNKGKVQLLYQQGNLEKQLTLLPGDLASLEEGEVKVRKAVQPSVYSEWKFHRFIFDNTPLQEIAEKVKEIFGVTMVIEKPELAALTISGAFPALDAIELVELLCDASGEIAFTKVGKNKIILTNK